MKLENRIWGRGLIAWTNLVLCVLNLAVGLISFNYFSLVNYFFAGLGFYIWLFDAIMYEQHKLVMKLCKIK